MAKSLQGGPPRETLSQNAPQPTRGMQISVAGRLLDVNIKAPPSLPRLKMELVAQLGMCSPASLQLRDALGNVLNTDEDLYASLQSDGRPLRASLTAHALREMEQKKAEVDLHNGELTTIQWQLLIEQMTFISLEMERLVTQVEVLKGACAREAQQEEEAEAERREDLVEVVRKLTADRQADESSLLNRIESLSHALIAEKSARDVADFQLEQRIEQVNAALNAESSARERAREELLRLQEAQRRDMELEATKTANVCRDITTSTKRVQSIVEEHVSANAMHKTRLTRLEAEADRMKAMLDTFESGTVLQAQALQAEGRRYQAEFRALLQAGAESWGQELLRLAEDTRASHLDMEERSRIVAQEVREIRLDGDVRCQALEDRCSTLERASQDALVLGASLEKVFTEKQVAAAEAASMTEASQKNSEAWLEATRIRIDEIARRTHAMEQGSGDRYNTLRESNLRLMNEQDKRLMRIEEEVSKIRETRSLSTRGAIDQIAAESSHRGQLSISSVHEVLPTSPGGDDCTLYSLTASPSTEPSRRRLLGLQRIEDEDD
mmetsp:Transcript_26777/g.61725  ORF Transcript_26777/g.61725 Transcript_26777/m.61725 type:complete len:554 (-) Transcript_26777:34-1695(-)